MKKNLKLLSALLALTAVLLLASLIFGKNQWLTMFMSLLLIGLIVIPLKQLFAWEKQFQEVQGENFSSSDKFLPKNQDDLKPLLQKLSQMKKQLEDDQTSMNKMSDNLEALLSHLTMGIILVATNKDILLQSDSLPQYFPEAQAPFKRLADISRMDIKALITQAFDRQKTIKKELKGFHEGDLILEVTAVPIVNQQQKVEQVLVLIYDLTTIRSYEKLNMDFISNASHELRTPVTSIKGFAETIKGMPEDETDLKNEFLDIIYNESLRLEHIVEHMLTLSKVKKTQLQKTEFSLNDFLHYIGNSMKHQLVEKKLELVFELTDDVTLNSDKYLLSQILLNLLSNAIRYTDEGGKITVSTSFEKECLAVTISDTGIGISQLELDRIFERFYRVNKGRSRQSGGTGLGLSIVKELSQILGGHVRVSSQLGQGSDFTLELPKTLLQK